MIYDFLNKRYSLKSITDEHFENIVPQLAEELSSIDFRIKYSEDKLKKDWQYLKKININNHDTSSTMRVGMRLCEHFFPNFYDIKNINGKSFSYLWNKENLIKVLRWNRKSHSTPYLSELKRGIYFCCGLTKNTMFRPHLAKNIVSHFAGQTILDPCSGWGGRMLGTLSCEKTYIGFEPNPETYDGLKRLAHFIGEKPILHNIGAEYISEYIDKKIDIILTSPPYFNLEIYSDSDKQSENMFLNYEDWKNKWLKDIIFQSTAHLDKEGVSCWNVHNVAGMKMIDDVKNIHAELSFEQDKVFSISSSKRQANQIKAKNAKSLDLTICYKKK